MRLLTLLSNYLQYVRKDYILQQRDDYDESDDVMENTDLLNYSLEKFNVELSLITELTFKSIYEHERFKLDITWLSDEDRLEILRLPVRIDSLVL